MRPRVVASRRERMALILSRHKSECTTCTRNGNCMIQRNAAALNITNIPYPVEYDQQKNPTDFPLVRDASKCISCMRCVSMCSTESRKVPAPMRLAAHLTLKKLCSERKEPKFYL